MKNSIPWRITYIASLLALTACSAAPEKDPPPTPQVQPPAVVLMTDFSLRNDAVALMRGVVLKIAPCSRILDLTHEAPAFDVRAGGWLLEDAPGYFPDGTVFVVVIDPGVGTERRPLVARLENGSLVVAPDNGVLTRVIARHGPAEVRHITNKELMLSDMSSTFHGRDLFAPVGAHLAAGAGFEAVGPIIDDWRRLKPHVPTRKKKVWTGLVVLIDHPYGNVWTNLPANWREGVSRGTQLRVTLSGGGKQIGPLEIPSVMTFGDVPEGQPLLYSNSRNKLALALNMGSFTAQHGVELGMTVRIEVP